MTAPAPIPRQAPRLAEPLRALALIALILPLAWGGAALAQTAVSAAIDSDYRVRGVSFSDGRPAASLSLSYDSGGGLYAGATGVLGDTDEDGIEPLGYQVNLGYAARTPEGWSWDVGVSTAGYTQYLYPRRRLSYSEVYAGVSAGGLSAHLYWSPDYLGQQVQTLYGEVDGAARLRPNLTLFAHAGLLAPLGGGQWASLRAPRYDVKAGVAVDVRNAELRLAWSRAQAGARDLPGYFHGGEAVTVGASWSF